MIENTIEMKSLIELRNGRIFYVPAYQRGYRWNEEQVKDLLDDLYSFASGENKELFYCLQPIIVKKISKDSTQWRTIVEKDSYIDREKEIYEVVDGQQRLTTLYILLQYIIDKANEEDKEDERKAMYNLIYETRKEMTSFLENIATKTINDVTDIDRKHAFEAYRYIDEWVTTKKTQIGRAHV